MTSLLLHWLPYKTFIMIFKTKHRLRIHSKFEYKLFISLFFLKLLLNYLKSIFYLSRVRIIKVQR